MFVCLCQPVTLPLSICVSPSVSLFVCLCRSSVWLSLSTCISVSPHLSVSLAFSFSLTLSLSHTLSLSLYIYMCIYIYIYISVWLCQPVSLPFFICASPSVSLLICVYLSVGSHCPPVFLFFSLSLCIYIYIYICVSVSASLSLCLSMSVCLFVSFSVAVSVYYCPIQNGLRMKYPVNVDIPLNNETKPRQTDEYEVTLQLLFFRLDIYTCNTFFSICTVLFPWNIQSTPTYQYEFILCRNK